MYIQKLREEDVRDVFKFEGVNKEYFEKMVPARPVEYFTFESYNAIHPKLLEEQANGVCHFYLIRNDQHNIMGRINLVDIDSSSKSCHLGYRIGKDYVGKGVGTRALGMLIKEINKIPITTIYAKTTATNKGSQLVLERNNFKRAETTKEELTELNGEKQQFVSYGLYLA